MPAAVFALTPELLGSAGVGAVIIIGYVGKFLQERADKAREQARGAENLLPPTAAVVLSNDANQTRLILEKLGATLDLVEHVAKVADDMCEGQSRVIRALKRIEDANDRQLNLIRNLDDAVRSRPKG